MPAAEEPIRHSGAAPGDSVTTENSRIGTLHTTRQCGIPSADLLGLAQLEGSSFLVHKLSDETDCVFGAGGVRGGATCHSYVVGRFS